MNGWNKLIKATIKDRNGVYCNGILFDIYHIEKKTENNIKKKNIRNKYKEKKKSITKS